MTLIRDNGNKLIKGIYLSAYDRPLKLDQALSRMAKRENFQLWPKLIDLASKCILRVNQPILKQFPPLYSNWWRNRLYRLYHWLYCFHLRYHYYSPTNFDIYDPWTFWNSARSHILIFTLHFAV